MFMCLEDIAIYACRYGVWYLGESHWEESFSLVSSTDGLNDIGRGFVVWWSVGFDEVGYM